MGCPCAIACLWWSKDNFPESLFFSLEGSSNWIQVIRLGGMLHDLLSHLVNPKTFPVSSKWEEVGL